MNADTLQSSISNSYIDQKANISTKKARFKVPHLPLSSRNDSKREEIQLIKKLYYNPFNELICYKEFKQHEKNLKQIQQQIVINEKQNIFTKRTNSANEILPKSLIFQNYLEEISPQENCQNIQQIVFTERMNRQSSLQGNQALNNEKSYKQYLESRKSSLLIEDFKQLYDQKQESQNNFVIPPTQPVNNGEIFQKMANQNKQIEIKRNQVNYAIDNFIGNKQFQKNDLQNTQKTQKQQRVQKPKALSLTEDLCRKQEQKQEEEIEQIKKRATQETLAYKEIKQINKLLKKQRCQTTRFLNRTKKKKEQIELDLKQDVEVELDTKTNQEKQIIKYIIREQLNPQRPQEEIQKMFEETLRSNQIKNFLDKLKIEKASFVANKIISKIKTFSGNNILRNKYFSDLEKDPKSLAKPLSVLVDYDNSANADLKLKNQTKMLSLKDDLKIDFFKQIDTQNIKRKKIENIYDFRSKALTMTMSKQITTPENKTPSQQKNSIFQEDGNLNFHKIRSIQFQQDSPLANSEEQVQDDHQKAVLNEQIQSILNKKQDQYLNDQTPVKKIMVKTNTKRKSLLNGGIEYEYINELGFKIRVQQPPKKKEYKEVEIQKFQKKEDIFFKKFVDKANKIANEVEVRNRISDNTHKKQMKSYHK
ncbi:hypothetical protein TTHERM_00589980 (macronuclear) [Tetrahymena thermophila SB210]|uniref:Uncharacterized protein n=1 Tax=Tetrahymena thermophila (strain SB210) TaxID=312017 RepID=I7LVT0_TETTS|nr:hypothetical protein TTHERM_00589980 [Tetrahymena thermophila SB210]EAR99661.1 hypothetical protein TTHERM_00589980 [Tetrahymena thermophila SB210]|eukprot:XP_001019906.1 hypothetical protein TTHERM_00589980 [Tetrahymena thermophila SB210]